MHRRRSLAAYTLVEMLTTIAALLIVLGLMMNLARHVRASSATALTKELLRRLDYAMNPIPAPRRQQPSRCRPVYRKWPLCRRCASGPGAPISTIRRSSACSGPITFFRPTVSTTCPPPATTAKACTTPGARPSCFMTRMNPAVGMAAQGWFFFSAGPDRKYTTKSDNLYSYELPTTEPSQR